MTPDFIIEILVKARRELGDVMQKAAAEVDKLTQAEARRADVEKRTAASSKETQKSVNELSKSYEAYTKKLEAGQGDHEIAIKQLNRFSQEFDRLAKKTPAGSAAADELLKLSRNAKTVAADLDAAMKARTKQVEQAYQQAAEVEKSYAELDRRRVAAAQKADADEKRRLQDREHFWSEILNGINDDEKKRSADRAKIIKSEEDEFDRVQQARIDALDEADRAQAKADADAKKAADKRASDAKKIADKAAADAKRAADKATADAKKAADKAAADAKKVQDKIDADAQRARDRATETARKQIQDQVDLRNEIARTISEFDRFAGDVRGGFVPHEDARVGLTQHAQTLKSTATRATRTFGAGSPEALDVGLKDVEARDLIHDIDRSAAKATPSVGRFTSALQRLFRVDPSRVEEIDKMLENIGSRLEAASYNAVHFAGTLRALVYVGVIVFFGQLVSGAIAVAGALTSLASAAITAGAAVGGALAAGAAQAIPVIGLLGAAWGRVGAIFKAVQQNIKAQNQAGVDQASTAGRQADAADRLTSAQQALTSSQEALTKSRADAQRQIEDLTAAEQRAQLQAESAALAQLDAQKALDAAIRTGDVSQAASLSLRARQSTVDVSQSHVDLARASQDATQARSLGVSGAPSVVAATQGVEAARRALANAKRDANDLGDSVSSADNRLKQMLGDLSPVERDLYEVLNRVVKKYREVFTGTGGVIESITKAFTFGAKRVLSLLDDDRLIGAARRLANSISHELRRAFSALSDQSTRGFIEEISDQARRNLPTITDFALQVLKIVEALSKAGGPALTRFLDFFATLATRGALATGSDSGLERLQKFFLKGEQYAEDIVALTGAFLGLFGAIIGASAQSGDDLIKSITASVREATTWINDHQREVKQFFADAIEASKSIASALANLARGLFSLFNSDQVTTFAHALTRTFLPAMKQVFEVLGLVADAFLKLAGTGTGSAIGQFLLVWFGLNKTLVPIVRLFGQLGLSLGGILKNRAIVGFFGNMLTKLGPIGLAATAVAAGFLLINSRLHLVQRFKDLFVDAQERSKLAADKLTDSINKQLDALRKQKDAGDALQGSRLSLARAEIAVERARQDQKRVEDQIQKGQLKGRDADLARRDASLGVKQAVLDEKQAREELKTSKDADNKADQTAVTQSKQVLDNARTRINALQDERKQLTERRDEAKRNVQAEIDTANDSTKSVEQRQRASIQLKDDLVVLQDAQDALNQNTKDLRAEADRSVDAFKNYRKAVKNAGKSTDTFGNIVDDTIDGIVHDVNTVLVEFGAKPLRWTAKRKKTAVEDESGSDAIFGTPSIGGFPGRQEGGYAVPGHGTGDSVYMQAKVEPGEKVFVLNRMASKAMDGLRWLNNAIPRFAKGGEINWNGHPQNVHQPVKDLLAKIFGRWPGLSVTSTTDHSLRTTSGNISDHSVGNAVDVASSDYGYMNRVAEWIKSSGLYRYLKQGIHNPNLAVNAGKLQTPPGQFAGAVWSQHANHIHLAIAGAIGKLIGGITSVAGRTIGGPAGRLTDSLRGIASRVVRAANSFVRRQTSSSTSDEGFAGVPTKGDGADLMRSIAKNRGWSFDDWWAIDAIETGHGKNLVNPTSTARLRGQFLDSNWGKYGPGSDPRQNPSVGQQIQSFAEYIAKRYGNPTKALQSERTRGFYALGGEVAGRLGQAVPIMAHAGEWVVNKIQQSKLAQMVGTGVSHLRGALGFTGGHGSYAGGGEVSPYSIPSSLGTDPTDIERELGRAARVVKRLKSGLIDTKFTDALSKTFDAIAGDGGLLDLLGTAVTDLTNKLDTNLKRALFKVTRFGQVVKNLSDQDVAQRTLDNLKSVYEALNDQQEIIQGQLSGVAKRLRSDKLTAGERTYLEGVKKNLSDRLSTVKGAVADNLQAQFDAIENAITTRVNSAQDTASAESAVLDLQARARTIAGSTASSLLGLPSPEQIGKVRSDILNAQAAEVAKAARDANRAGHGALAASLNAQVAELQQQAIEAVAQGLRDAESDIDARASRQSTAIALRGRVADLRERVGDVTGAFALRGSNLQDTQTNILGQIGSYTALLGRAQASGQSAVAEELVDKIADLNQQLAENAEAIHENTVAARTAAITAITGRQGFFDSLFGGLTGIVNSLGEASGVTDNNTLRTILQQTITTLTGTGSGLLQKLFENFGIDLRGQSPAQLVQSLLGINYDSIRNGLQPDERQQFDELITSIIGNTTATVDNTKQLNDISNPTAQSFSSGLWETFRRAVFNGAGGLLPQFANAVPSLAGPGFLMSGAFTGHGTSSAVAATRTQAGGEGDVIIHSNITTPTIVHDPVDEARQLAFAYKNRVQR